jgi:SAM-dependent methyltransferase
VSGIAAELLGDMLALYPERRYDSFNKYYFHLKMDCDYKLMDSLKLNGARVLDIGSGIPVDAILFDRAGAGAVSVDYSDEGFRHPWTRELVKRYPGSYDFVISDAVNLPFGDETFDVVVSLSAIEHLRHSTYRAWIEEMRRVLAPGGHMVLVTSNRLAFPYAFAVDFYNRRGTWNRPPENTFWPWQLESELGGLGFRVTKYATDGCFHHRRDLGGMDLPGIGKEWSIRLSKFFYLFHHWIPLRWMGLRMGFLAEKV